MARHRERRPASPAQAPRTEPTGAWTEVTPAWAGIIGGGLPQLPLTALNSVVAVCQLSGDLFPSKEARPAFVAASVGLMNLVGPWLGALPCCHGAGGLAAQVSCCSVKCGRAGMIRKAADWSASLLLCACAAVAPVRAAWEAAAECRG